MEPAAVWQQVPFLVSEGTLQYLLGGISKLGGVSSEQLLTKITGIENGLLRASAALGIKGLNEVTEEELQLVLQPVYRSIVFGEDYDAPTIEEYVYTAVVSFAMLGVMEAGDIAFYARNRPVQAVEWDFSDTSDFATFAETDTAVDPDGNMGYDGSVTDGIQSINQTDRAKIDHWTYTPSDEQYLRYKGVYDNPKYYRQETGAIIWPENNGFTGTPKTEILQPGTRIDRYGSDFGSFVSPEGTPYNMRAVAPGTEIMQYSVFEVVKPLRVTSGEILPWFDEIGGGIQYLLPETIDDLLEAGIIRRIK